MRTPEQIEGLKIEKTGLPEYSMFSDPNWLIIDAKISILDGKHKVEHYIPDDIGVEEFEEKENDIYRAAQEAQDWLNGEFAGNLFGK